ncbi:chorismate mutase [Candidatus Falkowbacteria bacterium RBG_13_39_14]|uniref:Chorismate mutase n=1 Tax=Candidatus Falkowbacteria bacterium RBG_13_39_14 TaxID=1797985 RepID=A0A1F5S452_9BACT|nr:MAG: chorismate mutase [Candidatus Falkowbacteria bacterium RBG_13_39_14]
MENLDELRKEIDNIDREIFLLLKKRFDVVKKVGEYKKKNNLPIRDLKREGEIIRRKAREMGMDEEFVEEVYRILFSEAYRIQQ